MPPLIRPEDEASRQPRVDAIADARAAELERLSASERKRAVELVEGNSEHFDAIMQELIDLYRTNYTGEDTIVKVEITSKRGKPVFFIHAARYSDGKYPFEEEKNRRYADGNNYPYAPAVSAVLAEKVAELTDDDPSRIIVGVSDYYYSAGIQGEKFTARDLAESYSTNTFTLSYAH